MQPLVPAYQVDRKRRSLRAIAQHYRMTVKHLKKLLRKHARFEEVWLNDEYVVHKRVRDDGWTELSIRRQDRAPITDWRHKQAIKNQLCGPECEGLELYPAESRLIDTSNQFWIWVRTDPKDRIPAGFTEGRSVNAKSVGGAVQRPPGEEAETDQYQAETDQYETDVE